MRFWIEDITLWYRNGGQRSIKFQNNKVNVITGDSDTGKTAIIQIFDYCFLASKSTIPDNTINENVSWYGIRFHINDKRYTIARGALKESNVSKDYFFSSNGELPPTPSPTHSDSVIRKILEPEFGIDRRVKIPFGGQFLRAGTKVSIRYFLLFNTISEDIITHTTTFFDKQNDPRYAEALVRIFDLATGTENLADLIAREEHDRVRNEITRLEKQLAKSESLQESLAEEISDLVLKAKELGIVEAELNFDSAAKSLRLAATHPETLELTNEISERQSELRASISLNNRIIRNLKLLVSEYDGYRKDLILVEDSLRPVAFLRASMSSLVQTSFFDVLLSHLEEELQEIKRDLRKNSPISLNIKDLISEFQEKESLLRKELSSLPVRVESFQSERDKFMFLGEVKAKLSLLDTPRLKEGEEEIAQKIEDLESKIGSHQLNDTAKQRAMFLKLLEEIIAVYMNVASPAIETYSSYQPMFDYQTKSLHLRKPFTPHVENVGSSSNHMFLHLFLFLGLHEAIQIQNSPFVPSLLLIDQPSRPYWGSGPSKKDQLDSTDEQRIRTAFETLDHFMQRQIDSDRQFQIIVLEHVPPSTWDGLSNVQLVERFADGNALIRKSEI